MRDNPKVVSLRRNAAYLHHRAMLNRRDNRVVDALELMRRAVEASPDNREYRLDLAELLCENEPMPLKRIGARDRFGQVGKLDFLRREYKMTAEDIAQAAIEAIGQKNSKDHK